MQSVKSYFATSVGQKALETTAAEQIVQISGVTSKGIFLQSPGRKIIFLTQIPYRGPFTINVSQAFANPQAFSTRELALCLQDRLIFPTQGISVVVSAKAVWKPPALATPYLATTKRPARLKQFANAVVQQQPGHSLTPALAHIVGLAPSYPIPPDNQISNLAILLQLRHALAQSDLTKTQRCITELLGHGPGLTPTGDDIVTGIVLLLNRGRVLPWPQESLHILNKEIINSAHQQTTPLSANLIECAAEGSADERLLQISDSLLQAHPILFLKTEALRSWGHTSGMAVLLGMALVLSAADGAIC